jgi:hypothetical protein
MMIKRISDQLAPALLSIGSVLAAWNWYLRPERAFSWGLSLLVLGAMALVLLLASRFSKNDDARARAAESIRSGVVFAGLMMVLSLTAKLLTTLGGTPGHADLSRRGTMIILGVFLAFTGNTIPKTLTPLSALQCDGARVQAFQRFAGWTWVLTGLSFAIAWLILPARTAQPLSLALLVSGMLLIATQLVRLRFTRQKKA